MTSDVSIIGAGPAGLSAAIELARHGVRSAVYDENPKVGGAIFRQAGRQTSYHPVQEEKSSLRGQALFAELEKWKQWIDLELDCQVVGILGNDRDIYAERKGKVFRFPRNRVIVATGCYERAQPFPGWTLPGVMSVGGAQLQVKSGLVKPGSRVVLVGTGPLLLVAAKQMHLAGIQVLGVFEAGRRTQLLAGFLQLFADLDLLREGVGYLNYLKLHRIPVHYGFGVVEAGGTDRLERVTLAPYSRQWQPEPRKFLTIEADCLGVGYGYVPRIQLTQMMACRHDYDPVTGAYAVYADSWQRTSVPGIYAAGDNAGVLGSKAALHEGQLAALACLMDMKQISEEEAAQRAIPAKKRLQRIRRFQGAFQGFSRRKYGLLELPNGETIVCRCESVSKATLDAAISAAPGDITTLKMMTRIGMGECQGKMCGNFCMEYVARKQRIEPCAVGLLTPRFPLSPLPMSCFAKAESNGL